MKISKDPDKNWLNDNIQFPRLLTELAETVLEPDHYIEVARSMDLTVLEVYDLFERARVKWEDIKART